MIFLRNPRKKILEGSLKKSLEEAQKKIQNKSQKKLLLLEETLEQSLEKFLYNSQQEFMEESCERPLKKSRKVTSGGIQGNSESNSRMTGETFGQIREGKPKRNPQAKSLKITAGISREIRGGIPRGAFGAI